MYTSPHSHRPCATASLIDSHIARHDTGHILDTLTQFFTPDLSLWGLFISSFLAATLLPGGSEAVLAGVLTMHPELFWPALLLGTLGNTLGGMVTLVMGRLLPKTKALRNL